MRNNFDFLITLAVMCFFSTSLAQTENINIVDGGIRLIENPSSIIKSDPEGEIFNNNGMVSNAYNVELDHLASALGDEITANPLIRDFITCAQIDSQIAIGAISDISNRSINLLENGINHRDYLNATLSRSNPWQIPLPLEG